MKPLEEATAGFKPEEGQGPVVHRDRFAWDMDPAPLRDLVREMNTPPDWAGQKPLPKGVVVRGGSVEDVRKAGLDLLRAHTAEAEPEMLGKFSPDWPSYELLEQTGRLIVFLAWHGHTLIGYAVATLFRSGHYDATVCQHDVLYVRPEWRSRGVGLRLINRLRGEAKARGADHLLMHAKPGSALEALLPRLGFKAEETVWKEEL